MAALPIDGVAPGIEALVHDARRGDAEAFAELYRRHVPLVRSVLLAWAPPQDVPDLAHDTFLTAMRRLHDLREPAAFPQWLAAIARNAARAHRRGARVVVELHDNIPAPETDHSRSVDAEQVMRAIAKLPDKLREPLLLRLVEGMSGEQIAHALGSSHSAVRVALHRGMKLLRERLGEP